MVSYDLRIWDAAELQEDQKVRIDGLIEKSSFCLFTYEQYILDSSKLSEQMKTDDSNDVRAGLVKKKVKVDEELEMLSKEDDNDKLGERELMFLLGRKYDVLPSPDWSSRRFARIKCIHVVEVARDQIMVARWLHQVSWSFVLACILAAAPVRWWR